MANALDITLHALAAEAAGGAGVGVDIGTRTAVKLSLYVQAVTDESLTVYVETSPDDVMWRELGQFTAVSASPAVDELAFDRCERYVRCRWTLGTSASFGVRGEAHQLFVSRDGLATELPAAALATMSTNVVARALIRASCDVEDALGARYPLPITKVPESVQQRCAQIAAFLILKHKGFAGAGIDELVVKAYDDAVKWLKDVRTSELEPAGVEPTPSPDIIASSGNPEYPDVFRKRFSDDWGDF
jgi:phage gp36-like protein